MQLLKFASETYPAGKLDFDPKTEYFYNMVARLWSEFACSQTKLERYTGKVLETTDLSTEILLAWLKHLGSKGLAATTVNSYRSSAITLWSAAHEEDKAHVPPPPSVKEVPKRRVPKNSPLAWTPQNMERILLECLKLKGMLRSVPGGAIISRSEFMIALLLFLYDTGARIGAALEVEPEDIDLDNHFVTLRSGVAKTLLEQPIKISQQTADAIRKIIAPGRKVWPSGKYRHGLYARMKKLLKAAGLPCDRLSKFHRIRRTTATQTALHGSLEMASKQLGHTSIAMTMKYIDPRILRPTQAVDVIPSLHVG